MSKVFFDTGLSLDGYIAGTHRGPHNPLGDNGTKILKWMYDQKAYWRLMNSDKGSKEDDEGKMIEHVYARTGAYIMGKRTFEEGIANWPEDLFKTQVFVLTHYDREDLVQNGSTSFYFVKDPIDIVLQKAKQAANGKDVRIHGGARIIQQYLNAGLVDEFTLHLSSTYIGAGIRLFEDIDRNVINADLVEVVKGSDTAHLHYIVNKK